MQFCQLRYAVLFSSVMLPWRQALRKERCWRQRPTQFLIYYIFISAIGFVEGWTALGMIFQTFWHQLKSRLLAAEYSKRSRMRRKNSFENGFYFQVANIVLGPVLILRSWQCPDSLMVEVSQKFANKKHPLRKAQLTTRLCTKFDVRPEYNYNCSSEGITYRSLKSRCKLIGNFCKFREVRKRTQVVWRAQ